MTKNKMNLEERFRIRWRRWLGNKTATNKPYWTSLLDSNWSGWCKRVCRNHGIEYKMDWTQESVKNMYCICINAATIEELRELDDIYCTEKIKF